MSIHVSLSYAPNPRAVHPSGRVPSGRETKRKLPSIQNELGKNDRPIILIDGNNIRNEFQSKSVSALNLMRFLSAWSLETNSRQLEEKTDEDGNKEPQESPRMATKPEIICVWDGGSKKSSHWMDAANSTLSVFSGTQGNADDILVQCCAYFNSREKLTAFDNQIVVFTSDANLANRCKMQLMEEGSRTLKTCQIYHSIYLVLLLGEANPSIDRDAFTPDWERQERRSSVDELEKYLCEFSDSILSAENEVGCKEKEMLNSVNGWINTGMNELVISRVTKGGSVLYRVNDE